MEWLNVVVFCGSTLRGPLADEHRKMAQECGQLLASSQFTCVHGGCPGLGQELEASALQAGGRVRRICLQMKGCPVELDDRTEVFTDFAERKRRLITLGEGGYLALQGGAGTTDEIAEVLAWYTLIGRTEDTSFDAIRGRPMICVGRHYNNLWRHYRGLVSAGLCSSNPFDCGLTFVSTLEEAINILVDFRARQRVAAK